LKRLFSQVLGYRFELIERGAGLGGGRVHRALETMMDMIVNQRPLGIGDRAFDRPKLLGELDAGTPLSTIATIESRWPAARLSRLTISGRVSCSPGSR
jgi:hypothetical protein